MAVRHDREPVGDAQEAAGPPATPPTPLAPVEQLRRRLEKEPNARLYSQLVDELRKDGNLAEAVRACREGVERFPAYPTLRLTLGRALLDSGELAAARSELEAVLQAAPDNILGERTLGECLEALGDWPGPASTTRRPWPCLPPTPSSPARLRSVEEREAATGFPAPAVVVDDPLDALDIGGGTAPIPPLSALDLDLEPPPPPPAEEMKPIPLVAVDEPFVIERAGDVGVWKPPVPPPPTPAQRPAPKASAPVAPPVPHPLPLRPRSRRHGWRRPRHRPQPPALRLRVSWPGPAAAWPTTSSPTSWPRCT